MKRSRTCKYKSLVISEEHLIRILRVVNERTRAASEDCSRVSLILYAPDGEQSFEFSGDQLDVVEIRGELGIRQILWLQLSAYTWSEPNSTMRLTLHHGDGSDGQFRRFEVASDSPEWFTTTFDALKGEMDAIPPQRFRPNRWWIRVIKVVSGILLAIALIIVFLKLKAAGATDAEIEKLAEQITDSWWPLMGPIGLGVVLSMIGSICLDNWLEATVPEIEFDFGPDRAPKRKRTVALVLVGSFLLPTLLAVITLLV
jgi:NADH:ubiquinone oxidoreductase subunit 6 (subunit J)